MFVLILIDILKVNIQIAIEMDSILSVYFKSGKGERVFCKYLIKRHWDSLDCACLKEINPGTFQIYIDLIGAILEGTIELNDLNGSWPIPRSVEVIVLKDWRHCLDQ
jgi:hypothetical protein